MSDTLRSVVREYVAHYHAERNHEGLGNELIEPEIRATSTSSRVVRRRRLGGLLNYYEREAA